MRAREPRSQGIIVCMSCTQVGSPCCPNPGPPSPCPNEPDLSSCASKEARLSLGKKVNLLGGSPIDKNAIAAGYGLPSSLTVYQPEKMSEWDASRPLLSLVLPYAQAAASTLYVP